MAAPSTTAPGAELLLGDGKLRLEVVSCGPDFAETRLEVGGKRSERKGVKVPGVMLPITALTEKDRRDLALALSCPPDCVPAVQKRIIRSCRRFGKPVIVATQMLESMIDSPVSDTVMLSAESASGKFPIEAVKMMSRIIEQVECDAHYRQLIDTSHTSARPAVHLADHQRQTRRTGSHAQERNRDQLQNP